MGGCLDCLLPPSEPPKVWGGYSHDEPLTDGGEHLGAFKQVMTGRKIEGSMPVVMCFTQAGHAQTELLHESNILKQIGDHPNIIKHIEFFPAWGGGCLRKQSCLVLEIVEPAGNDLFEVHGAFKHSGSFMPVAQVKYYVDQLADGLKYINSKGVVHRDVKVENILVNHEHTVKLIDFGMAVYPPHFVLAETPRGDLYFAPELQEDASQFEAIKAVDLWGIGCVVYYLGTGRVVATLDIGHWRKTRKFEKRVRDRLQCSRGSADDFFTLLDQLLQIDPRKRGDFTHVRSWATGDKSQTSSYVRKNSLDMSSPAVLQKWPFRRNIPQAIGARLPQTWGDKFNGKTIRDLRLFELGLLVILVIKEDQKSRHIISCVEASTTLHRGDWIFFGVQDHKPSPERFKSKLGLEQSAMFSITSAKSKKDKDLVWFFPVFDMFEFQEHHYNAVLGPRSTRIRTEGDDSNTSGERRVVFARADQNAMDLRSKFKINLCGIVNEDSNEVRWWPGPDQAVARGDRGLVMRVPNFIRKADEADAEVGGSSVKADTLKDFIRADRFFEKIGIQPESDAAQEWWERARHE